MQKYSRIFGKTVKTESKEATIKSHKLLYKAGFIRESTAGRYYFLPLGIRVHKKIEELIRKNMNAAGAQELLTPVLHPLELWKETNRDNEAGFELMKIQDRRGFNFALGGTAEEMIIDLVRKFQISYKDLPFNVYQFSMKFRDEMRAKGGLLRVREFVMKDAYSFHTDEKDFKKEYELMKNTYKEIYEQLGLKTHIVLADNGYIGGDYSHEFIVESDSGESRFFVSEDESSIEHEDIATFDMCEMNFNEEALPIETIEQPEWVKTMEDNIKHYNQPAWRFLKNVVYKNRVNKQIIVVTIRGDLEVNKTKLEKLLQTVGQIEEATVEDLSVIGSKPGYVHSWGNTKVTYVADLSLKTVRNFIGGQKQENKDTKNVNYGRDFTHKIEGDVAMAEDRHTKNGNKLIAKKGIEVGNIFQLGTHYSSKMKNATYTNDKGEQEKYYMGCYGIGLGRTLATIVEINNDEKGIIWPKNVTPYEVYLVTLGEQHNNTAQQIITELESNNLEVLWDERENVGAGEKFADADLIGIPVRLVISDRSIQNGGIEYKERASAESKIISVEEIVNTVKKYYK